MKPQFGGSDNPSSNMVSFLLEKVKTSLEPKHWYPNPPPLPSPLPEWLWLGRVVKCKPQNQSRLSSSPSFEGMGAIVKHGDYSVFVRPYSGGESVWYLPTDLIKG